jgi:hypothetical protein
MSKRSIDHERYLGKIQSMARAEDMQNKDRLKEENNKIVKEERTCLTCGSKHSCKKFNGKTSTTGVYSVGGDVDISSCKNWKERKDKLNDPKKIKSLLKQFSNLRQH